jgi:hypothetical protein
MKLKTVFLFIAIAMGSYCFSQCDKKIILSATGAEILDDQDKIKIKDTLRVTTIKYDTKVFEITTEFATLHGTIDSISCNWKIPFKEGNTFIKGKLSFENGDQWGTTLNISGKDGKLSLLTDMEHPDANKMRFALEKFEESK